MTENAKVNSSTAREEHLDEDLYWKQSMISTEVFNNHSNKKMTGSLTADMETLSIMLEKITQENTRKMEELKRYQENRFSLYHRRNQLRTSIQKLYKLNKDKQLLQKEIAPVNNEFDLVEVTRGSYDWSSNAESHEWLGSCVTRHISHSFDLGLLRVGEIIEVNQNYKWVSAVVLQIRCDLSFFRCVKVKLRTKQWEPSVWVAVEDGRIRRCNGETVSDTFISTTSINILATHEEQENIKQGLKISAEDEKSLPRPSTASSSSSKKSSVTTSAKKVVAKKKRKREEADSDESSEYHETYEYRSQPTKRRAVTKNASNDQSTQCEQIILDDDEKSTTITVPKVKGKNIDQDEEMTVEIISTSPAKKKNNNNNSSMDTGEEAEMTVEIINYHSRNGVGNSGNSNNCSAPLSLPGSENSSRSDHDGSDSPSEDTHPTEAKAAKPQPKQPQSVVTGSTFTSTMSVVNVPLPNLVMRDPRVALQQKLYRHQYVPLYGQVQRAPLPGIGSNMTFARRHPLQYHPDLLAMGMEQGGTTYRLGSNGAVLKNEEKK